MSRYIDADELKRSIHGTCSLKCISLDNLFAIMDKQPSIDIVRCKECRYYHQLYGCQKHDDIDLVTSDDDFCSYGERKDNE